MANAITTHPHSTTKIPGPLALGGWVFGPDQWGADARTALWAAMETALTAGLTHFDTATGYGDGQSETLLGDFLQGRRQQVFLASKAGIDQMDAALMHKAVDESLTRLKTDYIDLYYIHWPRQGKDMRPLMEGLEQARAKGKIGQIGVSNFSVEQMEQVRQAGQIDAHQLGYNLLWRVAERDVIPYCRQHSIAVVTYSSIAQGVLTGKFPRHPQLGATDSRSRIIFFEEAVWPHVYAGVEKMKEIAREIERPLAHLAIRWVLQQAGISTAIVGARNPQQAQENAQAFLGEISPTIFTRLTAISDEVMANLPAAGNMYRYYP